MIAFLSPGDPRKAYGRAQESPGERGRAARAPKEVPQSGDLVARPVPTPMALRRWRLHPLVHRAHQKGKAPLTWLRDDIYSVGREGGLFISDPSPPHSCCRASCCRPFTHYCVQFYDTFGPTWPKQALWASASYGLAHCPKTRPSLCRPVLSRTW